MKKDKILLFIFLYFLNCFYWKYNSLKKSLNGKQPSNTLNNIIRLRKTSDGFSSINKRYRNRKMDEFIDEIPIEEENPENIIIDQEQQARLERFVGNKLTKVQKEIFYKLVFENKKQSTIARELGITRQAVNESVNYIKKKFKKFYKLPWQILKKLLIKWKEEYPFI